MENHQSNRQSTRVRKCQVEDNADRESLALQNRAVSAVSQIRAQFADLQAELEEARYVIASLQSGLRLERAKQREVNDVPVAVLRRQVAYRLHPDRGVDPEIMSRLNALFDLVESMQQAPDVELAA